MKRCPVCSKTYDDGAIYCSIDAQTLVGVSDTVPPATLDKEIDKDKDAPQAAPDQAGAALVQPPDRPAGKHSNDPYIGKTLNNKFRIDAMLGRGGMGAVYRATDTVLDRTVAVKLLRQDLLGDENLDSRFLREARAAARIEHPNAVTVHDFGTLPEGSAFIVMEFIQGMSLRDLLKRGGALQPGRAMEVMKQACSAVAAAHQVGVIHRDLKPENIMLKDLGVGFPAVKVVDFGLAKLKESVSQSLANLTSKGEIIGTPFYMSPEQCNGSDIDERTDLYSLGIIFYEMLMGRPPFQGSAAAVIGMHLYKPVPSLSDINPNVPDSLSELVMEMLHKEREQRPSTLGQILRRLDDLQRVASQLLAAHPEEAELDAEAMPGTPNELVQEIKRQKAATLKLQEKAEATNNGANTANPSANEQKGQSPSPAPASAKSAVKPPLAFGQTSENEMSAAASTRLTAGTTQDQLEAPTVRYDSVDFRTQPSAPLTVPPKTLTTNVNSNDEPLPTIPVSATVAKSVQVKPTTPQTTAIASASPVSIGKLVLIGLAGIIFGLLLAFGYQSISGPANVKPTRNIDKSNDKTPSPNSSPAATSRPNPPRDRNDNKSSTGNNKNNPKEVWRSIVGKGEDTDKKIQPAK